MKTSVSLSHLWSWFIAQIDSCKESRLIFESTCWSKPPGARLLERHRNCVLVQFGERVFFHTRWNQQLVFKVSDSAEHDRRTAMVLPRDLRSRVWPSLTCSMIPIHFQYYSWSIFLLGPGGIVAVVLVKRYGRLPVSNNFTWKLVYARLISRHINSIQSQILFWSQLIGLGFLIGCALAPDLNTFAGQS